MLLTQTNHHKIKQVSVLMIPVLFYDLYNWKPYSKTQPKIKKKPSLLLIFISEKSGNVKD